MDSIKGYYINLDECEERRSSVEDNIKQNGLEMKYQRFRAIKGERNAGNHAHINLTCGELGIWKSWLTLLNSEAKKVNRSYRYLHILEDDAELSSEFKNLIKNLDKFEPKFDILVTDMYANPSIYKTLIELHNNLKSNKQCAIYHDTYTGCCSSMLIPESNINKIYNLLNEEYNKKNPYLLPLDNQLRLLVSEKKLIIARTAPFLTSVRKSSINKSTIQPRKAHKEAVVVTQNLCYQLRRELSTLSNTEITIETCKLLMEAARVNENINASKIRERIMSKLLLLASEERILQYNYTENLIGQPDNMQSLGDID